MKQAAAVQAAEKLHIAYFGRPASFNELDNYSLMIRGGGTPAIKQIAPALGAEDEYISLNQGSSDREIIDRLYTELFNHQPTNAVANKWLGKLSSGKLALEDLPFAIMNSARGNDLKALNNKVAAATAFTTAINTPDEIIGYSHASSYDVVRDWLAAVGSNKATLTFALSKLNQVVEEATGTGVVVVPPDPVIPPIVPPDPVIPPVVPPDPVIPPGPVVPPVVTPPVTGVVGDLGPIGGPGPAGPTNVIIGTDGPDNLTGVNDIKNIIHGGIGNDTIVGGNLNDVLNGGSGRDIMTGGLGDDIFLFVNRLETNGVGVGVPLISFNEIDRITDFNGNGTSFGDRIQFSPTLGAFGQDQNFVNVNKGVVTQVTVQNNAPNFDSLLASIESAANGVASTNSLVQFSDVTITAGNGAYNGGAGDHVLVFNTGASQINALDTFIGIVGSVVPNDIIFT